MKHVSQTIEGKRGEFNDYKNNISNTKANNASGSMSIPIHKNQEISHSHVPVMLSNK